MPIANVSTGEMVEIQLRKWMAHGHLHNVVLRPKYSHPSLPEDEIVVAEVIDRSGQSYFFTNNGFTLHGKGFVAYQEIKTDEWISFKPDRARRKAEDFDYIEFLLLDDSQVKLTDVEQAVFPLLNFFKWMLNKRKHTDSFR
jgi:hypothetical protein